MTDPYDPLKATIAFESLPLSVTMTADLRSDHAGEVGAVMIYRGILAVSRDPAVCAFARRHLDGERRHQAFFDDFLPAEHQSRLLPVWRLAGWLTGALPALVGPRAVYATIEAVETFVDRHYADQIVLMSADERLDSLRSILDRFRREEVEHRDDAALRSKHQGRLTGAWQRLVALGSAAGVALARQF
jgi:ubiquinone biosynthesis monooxygenase Coq7